MGYWKINAKKFAMWFSTGLAGGAIPGLVTAINRPLMWAIWLVAIPTASFLWYRDRRKVGIGVFVHLPRKGDAQLDPESLKKVYRAMEARHHDWFRSGPDVIQLTSDLFKRIEWTIQTIWHRLSEARERTGEDSQLFLYIHSRAEESFTLGAQVSAIWKNGPNVLSHNLEDAGDASLDFRVRSLAKHPDKPDEIFDLDLSKAQAVDHNLDLPTERTIIAPGDSEGLRPRLAFVVYVAKNVAEKSDTPAYVTLKKQATEAARGRQNTGFLVTDDDICDSAIGLFLPYSFIDALKNGGAEKYIQQLRHKRKEWSSQIYGTIDVPVRLFVRGPSILTFALGAILPEGSRLVPWVNSTPEKSNNVSIKNNNHDLIAIIDGDNVGDGMESRLLAGNLEEAIRYSGHIDQSIQSTIKLLYDIPGVKLLSSAGDSAIFGLQLSSRENFECSLGQARRDLDIDFSCGYGSDCQQAFLALRIAKTTGKNVSFSKQ